MYDGKRNIKEIQIFITVTDILSGYAKFWDLRKPMSISVSMVLSCGRLINKRERYIAIILEAVKGRKEKRSRNIPRTALC